MPGNRPSLSPRFDGPRFAQHSIPLELLPDLGAYRDLIKDVAKNLYKADHPEKKRVPSGFEATFKLSLKGIGEGSAIAELVNDVQFEDAEDDNIVEFAPYFTKAKELVDETIRVVATEGGGIPKDFPIKLLPNFGRIGKNLKSGEVIDFGFGQPKPALFSDSVRKTLVLWASDEVESPVDQIGVVTGIKKDETNEFDVKLEDGKTVAAPLPSHVEDDIISALKDQSKAVRIRGHGMFNKQNRLLRISEIKELEVLDSDDLGFIRANRRLEEMGKLPNGWCNGQGGPVSHDAIKWASGLLVTMAEADVPPPYVFPTPKGEIQLEWEFPDQSADLRLDFTTKSAHLTGFVDDDERELQIKLDSIESVNAIIKFLNWATPETAPEE